MGFSNPGVELVSPVLAGGFFTTKPPGKPMLLVGGGRGLGAVKGKGSWHPVCR